MARNVGGIDLSDRVVETCFAQTWFQTHPARAAVTKIVHDGGAHIVAVRLYGDDAQDYKGSASLILNWCGCAAMRRYTTWLTRMLVTLLPLGDCVDEALTLVYALVRWSFQVLLSGEHPYLDPFGHESVDKERGARAGRKLDPRWGSRDALGNIAGDWKWLKEAFGLR